MGDKNPLAAADFSKVKLNKVKTKESGVCEVNEEDLKGYIEIFNSAGGFEGAKKHDVFKMRKFKTSFNPASAEQFAEAVCNGLAFQD